MKILLVEDDREIAALLLATLTAHRYTVDLARDGQLALELLRQWDYDLIGSLSSQVISFCYSQGFPGVMTLSTIPS